MTNAEYIRIKAQVAVIDDLLSEFRENTSLGTAKKSLQSRIKHYESTCAS